MFLKSLLLSSRKLRTSAALPHKELSSLRRAIDWSNTMDSCFAPSLKWNKRRNWKALSIPPSLAPGWWQFQHTQITVSPGHRLGLGLCSRRFHSLTLRLMLDSHDNSVCGLLIILTNSISMSLCTCLMVTNVTCFMLLDFFGKKKSHTGLMAHEWGLLALK